MLAVHQRGPEVVLVKQLLEQPLPLLLRLCAEITIQPEQVERIEEQTVLIASGKIGLQLGEVSSASWTTTTSPSMMA